MALCIASSHAANPKPAIRIPYVPNVPAWRTTKVAAMSAYLIFDIHVTDPEGYEPYRQRAAGIIEAQGGRYLVRGGAHEPMEGEWDVDRVVVVEFDSIEQAKAAYASPEYQEIAPIRQGASEGKAILVQGV